MHATNFLIPIDQIVGGGVCRNKVGRGLPSGYYHIFKIGSFIRLCFIQSVKNHGSFFSHGKDVGASRQVPGYFRLSIRNIKHDASFVVATHKHCWIKKISAIFAHIVLLEASRQGFGESCEIVAHHHWYFGRGGRSRRIRRYMSRGPS